MSDKFLDTSITSHEVLLYLIINLVQNVQNVGLECADCWVYQGNFAFLKLKMVMGMSFTVTPNQTLIFPVAHT